MAVRVLDAGGSGTIGQVVQGVDWVTADHQPGELAVANMSLGGGPSAILDTAVANSIADGITYGVAAGNNGGDACMRSPARVPTAITVGATTITDVRASFSNLGPCVTLFAPGHGILSAHSPTDNATQTLSGTSMATPHVVGVAALLLSQLGPLYSPQSIRELIVASATSNVVVNPGTGSPNKLLFSGPIGPPDSARFVGTGTGARPPTALMMAEQDARQQAAEASYGRCTIVGRTVEPNEEFGSWDATVTVNCHLLD